MITFLFLVFFVLVICFGVVIFIGAPYLPTRSREVDTALKLLNLKKGQTFYELGSGDGKVLLVASSHGLKCVGYELNPVLFLISKIRTYKHADIEVKLANFWKADISDADGVFVFLMDRYMSKLDRKLKNESKTGLKLASYNFKIRGKEPVDENDGVFLYQY